MNKETGEYCTGNRDLMEEKLTQVTKWLDKPSQLKLAITQLEKYGTAWVIKRSEGFQYALFRAKIERVV